MASAVQPPPSALPTWTTATSWARWVWAEPDLGYEELPLRVQDVELARQPVEIAQFGQRERALGRRHLRLLVAPHLEGLPVGDERVLDLAEGRSLWR